MFDFFRGKKPDAIPTLAEATARLDRARETQANDADALKRARDAMGNALLNAADDVAIARARKALAATEATEAESALRLGAAEAVHKAAQDAANDNAARGRRAAIDAKLDQRHASAVEIDSIVDTLAAAVRRERAIYAELRALDPPPSTPYPDGLPIGRLLAIVEFRIKYEPGETYAPFHTLEESRYANYLPGSKSDDNGVD